QRLTAEETAQVDADAATVRPLLASKGVAIAGDPERYMVDAAQTLNAMTSTSRIAMIAIVLLAAFGGA
ncbi:MAG TPA: phosphate ABC transporter permease subunit PstC, partial [Agrobacterium sp.]|nr:phosphate ABC transporter permease subunit PstC [Agrobacterium sp.]